jgi:hypothetical protein
VQTKQGSILPNIWIVQWLQTKQQLANFWSCLGGAGCGSNQTYPLSTVILHSAHVFLGLSHGMEFFLFDVTCISDYARLVRKHCSKEVISYIEQHSKIYQSDNLKCM